MDVHVTREVLASEAADWLLVWQREGWTPVASPQQVGVTVDGQPVLRLTLATGPAEQQSTRSAPREVDLPAWVPTTLRGAGTIAAPRGSQDRWPYDTEVVDRRR